MTPATVGDAILQDIIAQPEADDLRLIYADWLEDRGQPEYAEFIRVQCRLAEMDEKGEGQVPEEGHTCVLTPCPICLLVLKYELLQGRERRLLCSSFDKWHGLPSDPHGRVWDMLNFDDDDPEPERQLAARFHRGFVSEVRVPCDFWLQHGPRLAQKWPLERAKLTDRRPQFYLGRYWWLSPVAVSGGPSYACVGKLYQHLPQRESAASTDYDTPEAATDALSAALLAWARSVKCLACNDTGRLAPALGGLADCFCECDVGQALLEKDPAYQAGRRAAQDMERRVLEAIQGTKEPHAFESLYQGTWPRTGGE